MITSEIDYFGISLDLRSAFNHFLHFSCNLFLSKFDAHPKRSKKRVRIFSAEKWMGNHILLSNFYHTHTHTHINKHMHSLAEKKKHRKLIHEKFSGRKLSYMDPNQGDISTL